MQTEFPFTLPYGLVAEDGATHSEGVMRRALAGDEIIPLEHPRVQGNRAYLVLLLLARVIVRLGTLEGEQITAAVIERLYAADLAYLQRFYRQINDVDAAGDEISCPHCGRSFTPGAGESPEASSPSG
tara:strand:- start:34 stop:417 length:384 start_codon:yes stop_codon:yes gene_type:complete